MHKVHRFYKDEHGWFIDLPDYPGSKWNLAMVAGADTFLDMLSEGNSEVTLSLSTYFIEGYEVLKRKEILNLGLGGANYIAESYKGIEFSHHVWLCPVTLYVFMLYPKNIWFTVA